MNDIYRYACEARENVLKMSARVRRMPEGNYLVRVDDVNLRTRQDGVSQYILIDLVVFSGPHEGVVLTECISFNESYLKQSMYKLEEMLCALNITLDSCDYDSPDSVYSALLEAFDFEELLKIHFKRENGRSMMTYLGRGRSSRGISVAYPSEAFCD